MIRLVSSNNNSSERANVDGAVPPPSPAFLDRLNQAAARVQATLDNLLPVAMGEEARLYDAIRYASLSPGKRLRPFLVLESANLFHVSEDRALRVAAVVEMVHCYSLIHDDLPAMDNSPLRRGQPTVHVAFDEATAILAGDGLLTYAFQLLADEETHGDGNVRAELVRDLAIAAGPHGMVGGQMLDILGEGQPRDATQITRMQRLKTGMIMAFACQAGAVLGKASDSARQALSAYAQNLGLAFQLTDDLLDVEGREVDMGKKTDQDRKAAKATLVSIMGLERARQQANVLAEQAIANLSYFDSGADNLKDLARHIVTRRS
ncbi:MAG: polyprenyl synthetase family protein [Holosporaceae bacterium]|jgi:farnesyl diphosphate synthase|nr:polyprenyl synthetase family protein [Rhodospirillaceae bacterium]